jgi:hypothetical protein
MPSRSDCSFLLLDFYLGKKVKSSAELTAEGVFLTVTSYSLVGSSSSINCNTRVLPD